MPADPKFLMPGEGQKLNFFGTALVKLRGEDTGGLCALMENWIPSGVGPPLYRHTREDETFYVLEGELEFTVGGQSLRAPANPLVFGPRGIPHSFKNLGPSPAKMLVLFQPAGIERFFEEMAGMTPAVPPDPAKMGAIAARYGIEVVR